MIKQRLTPERAENIMKSTQFMNVMAEMIKIEFNMYMDVNFRNPAVNQHASRILESSKAIQQHLTMGGWIKTKSIDFREEYTAQLHRVFNFFIGLPVEQIEEFMDGVEAQAKEVTELTK